MALQQRDHGASLRQLLLQPLDARQKPLEISDRRLTWHLRLLKVGGGSSFVLWRLTCDDPPAAGTTRTGMFTATILGVSSLNLGFASVG